VNPVHPSEILSLDDYERARPERRRRILDVKAPRRIHVGEHLTLLFENHETMLYQVQEMLRVERIEDLKAIRHEIDTYNELVPGSDELSATLLIEYETAAERDVHLRELLGLEDAVFLDVEGAGRCRAEFDTRQIGAERISSVHYLKFRLGESLASALRDGASAAVVIEHPAMQERVTLRSDQREALADDLR
jgi:hypothetical protein